MSTETVFDVFRERDENNLSRYAKNATTGEIAYYCLVQPEQISIHRGDKTSPVIAITESFQGKDGITEIGLTESSIIVPMRHKHHTLPLMHGNSFFRLNGKQYQWKKHQELVEEDTGKVLARFESEEGEERIGRIVIVENGSTADLDIWVVTCLIDQERADEGRNPKKPAVE